MPTLIDALLAIDAEKIVNKETKNYEVERLSKLLGVPFILKLNPVHPKRYDGIQEQAIKMSGKAKYLGTDLNKLRVLTLCDGISEPNLSDKQLMKKFGAETPKELISKLFLAGEIIQIYEEIQKLSGLNVEDEEEKREEIKN